MFWVNRIVAIGSFDSNGKSFAAAIVAVTILAFQEAAMKRIVICLFAMFAVIPIVQAQDRVLTSEIVIKSSVDRAWWAMTTTDGMKAWNVHDAVIEMKVLGKYHTNYTEKVGDRGTITNTILSFIPNRMFSFKLGFPDNFTVPDGTGKKVPVPG